MFHYWWWLRSVTPWSRESIRVMLGEDPRLLMIRYGWWWGHVIISSCRHSHTPLWHWIPWGPHALWWSYHSISVAVSVLLPAILVPIMLLPTPAILLNPTIIPHWRRWPLPLEGLRRWWSPIPEIPMRSHSLRGTPWRKATIRWWGALLWWWVPIHIVWMTLWGGRSSIRQWTLSMLWWWTSIIVSPIDIHIHHPLFYTGSMPWSILHMRRWGTSIPHPLRI